MVTTLHTLLEQEGDSNPAPVLLPKLLALMGAVAAQRRGLSFCIRVKYK